MPDVIHFTDDIDHELLTSTTSGRFFTRQYLADRPLETYLTGEERPRYLLRNKQSGLRITGSDGTRTLEPDDDYQALLLCTDIRLLAVVGTNDGNKCESLRYADAVEADTQSSGFRTRSLVVETLSGETWEFPFRGDLSAVAAYVDETIQAWANATRLLDDVETVIQRASSQLTADGHEAAAETIADTSDLLQRVRERAQAIGPQANAHLTRRIEKLQPDLDGLTGTIQARCARDQHRKARDYWKDRAYEQAARAYEDATDAYARALETRQEHADGSLARRHRRALAERELLRVWPRVEADTARRQAADTADPETAAQRWTDALDGYRDMLGLDWGRETRSFLVDRERIREQTTAVADDAIADHRRAGESWLDSGDDLRDAGRTEQARRVYERAREQFGRAHELAREVRPERVEEIEQALSTVDGRFDAVDSDPGLAVEDSGSRSIDFSAGSPNRPDGLSSVGSEGVSASGRSDGATAASSGGPSVPSSGDTQASGRRPVVDPDTERATLAQLHALDEREFVDLVATVWESRGWSTTVFTTTSAVYDIVATQEETILLWAIHEAENGTLGSEAVERCKTTVQHSNGADSAALITSGELSDSARRQAETDGISVFDGKQFLELLEFEGLLDELPTVE